MNSTNYKALCYAVFLFIRLTSKKVHVQYWQLLCFALPSINYQVGKVVLYSLCGLTDSRRTNISQPFLGDTSISPCHVAVMQCDTAPVFQPTCRHNIVTSLIEGIRLPSDARVYCDLAVRMNFAVFFLRFSECV